MQAFIVRILALLTCVQNSARVVSPDPCLTLGEHYRLQLLPGKLLLVVYTQYRFSVSSQAVRACLIASICEREELPLAFSCQRSDRSSELIKEADSYQHQTLCDRLPDLQW
jgi:hypothetical protein